MAEPELEVPVSKQALSTRLVSEKGPEARAHRNHVAIVVPSDQTVPDKPHSLCECHKAAAKGPSCPKGAQDHW